jgi:uncharacterized ion transporter superfamily protein YfcC
MEIIYLTLIIILLIGNYKLFEKAHQAGWKSLIPFYNNWLMLEIAEMKRWLIFIPIVNVVASMIALYKISILFKKSKTFAILSMFFSFITIPVLAFGRDRYKKSPAAKTKKIIIEEKKEIVKKYNLLITLGIIILAVVLLSWLLPTTYYNQVLTEDVKYQVGIFDVFNYFVVAATYFSNILILILTIGVFYTLLNKIDAYAKLINKISSGFNNKKWLFISLAVVFLSVLTALTGLTVPMLFMFPFIISVLFAMGYNKFTAALVTIGSVSVGYVGLIYMPENTSLVNTIFALENGNELLARIVILVLGIAILIYNTLKYVKDKKQNKITPAEIKEYVPTLNDTKARTWPMIIILDVICLIFMIGMIPWETELNIKIFANATNWIKEFSIGSMPILYKLLGEIPAFGTWSALEYTVVLIIGIILLALIYKISFKDLVDAIIDGVRKHIPTVMLLILAYMVLVITLSHPFLLTIVKFLLELTKGFNIVTMSLVSFITAFFTVEKYYASLILLEYVKSVITDTALHPLIAVLVQAMNGLALLIAPTSIILLATLAYLKISFKDWMKFITKIILQLIVILFIVFIIMILI